MVVATADAKTHLTREEVARRWGISTRTVDEAISDGRLTPVRFGRSVRFPLAMVEEIDAKGFPSR